MREWSVGFLTDVPNLFECLDSPDFDHQSATGLALRALNRHMIETIHAPNPPTWHQPSIMNLEV
jgi:hypothetical protein